MSTLLGVLNHSIFLYPVTLCGILAIAITLERIYFLVVRASLAPGPFMAEIQRLVLAGNIDRAIHVCSSAPQAPLANVVKAALRNADAEKEDLLMAVEQATLDAAPSLQQRVGYLATVANVVTLFGLLGTIVGLIQSFDAVSQANPEEKQTLLAKGIAIAMYTTAGGISVAIPTLIAHSVLVMRGNAILDDVDRYALKVVMLLLARRKGTPEAVDVPPRVEAEG
jgi:biopolymer transport protein ExbB/TolQ